MAECAKRNAMKGVGVHADRTLGGDFYYIAVVVGGLSAMNGARVKADDTQRNQIVGEYVKALALAYDKLLYCLGISLIYEYDRIPF